MTNNRMNMNRTYRGKPNETMAAELPPGDYEQVALFRTLYSLMLNGFYGKVVITFENGSPIAVEDSNKWEKERFKGMNR
jgi:hypothetical protein